MTPSQLERRVHHLTLAVAALAGTLIVGTVLAFAAPRPTTNQQHLDLSGHGDTLRVDVIVARMIEIDDGGVARVRIGAKLPDAQIDGRRLVRGDDLAGVILYDTDGRERSGYGTFDASKNVVLTLDSQERQHALFVSGPEGATALRMWYGAGAIDFRTDEDGVRMSVSENDVVTLQEPALRLSGSSTFCSFLQDPSHGLTDERVWAVCRSRMGESWCQACIGEAR